MKRLLKTAAAIALFHITQFGNALHAQNIAEPEITNDLMRHVVELRSQGMEFANMNQDQQLRAMLETYANQMQATLIECVRNCDFDRAIIELAAMYRFAEIIQDEAFKQRVQALRTIAERRHWEQLVIAMAQDDGLDFSPNEAKEMLVLLEIPTTTIEISGENGGYIQATFSDGIFTHWTVTNSGGITQQHIENSVAQLNSLTPEQKQKLIELILQRISN